MNRTIIIVLIIALVIIAIILYTIPMNDTEISSLKRKISISDVIIMVALFLTLASSIFSYVHSGKLNTLLQNEKDANNLTIAKAEESSVIAKRDAEIANEKAMIAMEKAANADKKTAEIQERAVKAELKSKELEIKSKELEIKSKELEIELLRLRLDVGDRFLPIEIQEKLTQELVIYPEKTVTIIVNIANTNEPTKFANNLKAFFTKIGWKSTIHQSHSTRLPAPTGLYITSNNDCSPILQIITKHLNSINYEYYSDLERLPNEDLKIIIFAHK